MDLHVIRSEKIKKHNVEAYHFKVLGSPTNTPKKDEDVGIEEFIEEPTPRKKIKEAPSINTQEIEQSEQIEIEPTQITQEDNFVEKLLKKTDELSSNIIKLQMQIESQEAEFEKRLTDEISRAKEEGIKEGEEQANLKAKEQIQSLQEQYGRSVTLLENECKSLDEFAKKTESELSNVAIDVAKEVIQKELDDNSSKIALSLSHALMKEIENGIKIEIKVNPKDYTVLSKEFSENEHVTIKQDEAIAQGGVIILSSVGNLDGTISTRLEKIIQMMDE